MPSLTSKQLLVGVLAALSVVYPFLVYYFANIVPAFYFIIGIIGLMFIRAAFALLQKKPRPIAENNVTRFSAIYLSLAVAAVMLILYFWNSHAAPLFYPVVMSLAIAFLMGFTLLYPPSLIERFARLLEPDLDVSGVRYTRKVTVMWMIFGCANATISLVTVFLNNRAIWTLYNGCVSYILMGLLMAGEYAVRRYCKAKNARIAQGLK